MKTSFLFSILFVTQVGAFAQHISVGVKLGGTGTDTYTSEMHATADQAKFYTFGPSFEISLWKGLGLEVDALYRHVGYDLNYGENLNWRERSTSWEFPILAKYHFLARPHVQPFFVAGYAPRKIWGSQFYSIIPPLANPPQSGTLDTNYSVTHGVVAGGGLDLKAWHLRFSPEVRYTHWNQKVGPSLPYGYLGGYGQNQVQFLMGVSFP